MSETKGSKFSIRDVITVAAMLVINYMIAMVVSAVTLPFSEVYLYGSRLFRSCILPCSGKPGEQTWAVVCLGICVWPYPGTYGLRLLAAIFPDCRRYFRAVYDWKKYI